MVKSNSIGFRALKCMGISRSFSLVGVFFLGSIEIAWKEGREREIVDSKQAIGLFVFMSNPPKLHR